MDSAGNDESWEWIMSPRAEDHFSNLNTAMQDRIITKLDEVISSDWREPRDFLDPLTGSPFDKLRVGDYRIGCRVIESNRVLRIESIRKREGAYSADD